MERKSEAEARVIVVEELARANWQTEPTFTVRDGARPDTSKLEWWHENTPVNESSETLRNIAYLRAYLRSGGPRLYAGGLFLKRRRLWMDRSVMSRLQRDGYTSFEGADEREPYFILTDQGRKLTEAPAGVAGDAKAE